MTKERGGGESGRGEERGGEREREKERERGRKRERERVKGGWECVRYDRRGDPEETQARRHGVPRVASASFNDPAAILIL